MRPYFRAAIVPSILALLLAGCEGGQQGGGSRIDPDRVVLEPGENVQDFGEFEIHVNAFPTSTLPAEVAKGFGIQRSDSRVMLNVVIRRQLDIGTEAHKGTVSARVTNLTGQLKTADFREITEQDAIYYIAELSVADRETLVFDVDVSPEGRTDVYKLRYRNQFYTD